MKKPKRDIVPFSDVCMENKQTEEFYTYMRDEQYGTVLRSAFEEDAIKIAREFALNKKQMAKLAEDLKKKYAENFYFIIEDTEGIFLGMLELDQEDDDKAEIIIKYPAFKAGNQQLNEILREGYRNRICQTINRFCIEVGLTFKAAEYKTN